MNEAALLRHLFDTAVAAAQPALTLAAHLPERPERSERPKGRTVVIGAGKAAASMAQALEAAWDGPLQGLVVTRYGYELPLQRLRLMSAAHPVPDANSLAAAAALRAELQGLTEDDLVIALVSGGGSALLVEPAPGLTLADKQAVNQALLASGASIAEMNVLRRHLSRIKGGRLAAACAPARLLTLLISDVPGDDPAAIASGPTVPDPSTREQALDIVARYRLALPAAVQAWLQNPASESLKPDHPAFARAETRFIATPQVSLQAAAEAAQAMGLAPLILGDSLEGEARELGKLLAGVARQVRLHGQPVAAPCVLLSGGETTVTLRHAKPGSGGRNVECLLALAIALEGLGGVHALAADTDGVDGAAEVAGAWIAPDTLERAWQLGLNPREHLARHDGHGFFGALGQQVITGPTRTNVNDFRAILIR